MDTKKCPECGEIKLIAEFYPRRTRGNKPTAYCKVCAYKRSTKWAKENRDVLNDRMREKRYQTGECKGPLENNPACTLYLGIHIAERILSHYFEGITIMPRGNKGFDFICKKGYKIDVKSKCIRIRGPPHYTNAWEFNSKHNTIADYFLCLAFDNRESLTPLHVWLIPGNIVNHLGMFSITNTPQCLSKWSQYERPIDKVLECCTLLREEKDLR
jgi:hypothetical protein